MLAQNAQQLGECTEGVKGPAVCVILPEFNCVDGIATEVQHGCLGVTKQFVNAWLDSTNKNEAYYIGNPVRELDERIQKLLHVHKAAVWVVTVTLHIQCAHPDPLC